DIRRVIEAIKAGVPGAAVKDEMASLESRRIELLGQLESAPPSLPRLHTNLAELYRQKVVNLAEALNEEDTRLEAAECIRELIEEIRLVPKHAQLEIALYGELAALINLANGHPRSKGTGGANNAGCGDSQPPSFAACSRRVIGSRRRRTGPIPAFRYEP